MNCGLKKRTRRPRIPVILVIILVLLLPIALTALGIASAGTASILAAASGLLTAVRAFAGADRLAVRRA
jgi:hypothetical protein